MTGCCTPIPERTDILIESIPISNWQAILRECLIEKGLPASLVDRFKLEWQASPDFMDRSITICMSFNGKHLDSYTINPYQGDLTAQFIYVLREVAECVRNNISKPKEKPAKRKRAKVTLASRFRPHPHYKPSWDR